MWCHFSLTDFKAFLCGGFNELDASVSLCEMICIDYVCVSRSFVFRFISFSKLDKFSVIIYVNIVKSYPGSSCRMLMTLWNARVFLNFILKLLLDSSLYLC